ncbi:MAG: AI-2E family transporter [Patescibacteria group bacterium]|jgi:predicted PurR-regulated permease PerM
MNNNTTINISTGTLIKILIFLAIISFLFLIKEVLLILLVALILTAAFNPSVDWLHKHRIPRGLGILIIYAVFFATLSTAFILIIPPISREVTQLSENFPFYYEKISASFQSFSSISKSTATEQVQNGLNTLGQNLPQALSNVASTIFDVFGGLFSAILVLVITFYLIVQEEAMKGFIKLLTPDKIQPYLVRMLNQIQLKMGLWLRGQIILSLVIFTMVFIGLTILGVPYALVLAFLAGLLEVVPFIGPLVAAIPAVFFAFMQSPIMGISVIILFVVVQQLENNLIVPKIMSKAVDLNPLVVILAVLVGAKLGGIIGALLAVPVAAGLSVFIRDFMDKRMEEENKLA